MAQDAGEVLLRSTKSQVAPTIARERIFIGVLRDLEAQRIVPGQRLAETDLVARFGVSRNAVREGIQLLSERGIADLSPNKSPSIRLLSLEDALGVLDTSIVLTGLIGRSAAEKFSAASASRFAEAMAEVDAVPARAEREFSRAQRHFVRAMLDISQNRELQRIYPMVGMAIFTAQFRSQEMVEIQREGLRHLYAAITAKDVSGGERAGRKAIEKQRSIVKKFFA